MRSTTPSLIAAISLAVLAVIAAFADTPSGTALNGVFDPDLAEIKPEAIGKLKDAIKKAPRECYPPRVKFTVLTQNIGDPLFIKTLAEARVNALQDKDTGLPSLGLEPDQFKVDSVIGIVDGVLVSYGKFNDDDKEAPKLKVTAIPKEGSKVELGSQIEVTIKASERYQDGHKSWPTGVYNIQLIDDDGVVKSENYGKPPNPCATPTFQATYTVPCKSTVHLTAIVEDGAGHKDSWVGEFSTVGVWHGTDETFYDITSNDVPYNRQTYHLLVTFDLCETSKDKLEGQAHATWTSSQEGSGGGICPRVKTRQDPETVAWDMHLTGKIEHWSGSTRFKFQATPDRGPPYKWITPDGGEWCKGGTDERHDNEWNGNAFSLDQGQHRYDLVGTPPLPANSTGQRYFKFHVESSGK